MNTLKSKTNKSNRFVYQLTDKLNLKNPNKNIAIANLSIYYTWKNTRITNYKLELLSNETMQLLGTSKNIVDKNKNGELAPRLETVEVLLVHCNLVNNNYQQASKMLLTFVPNKQFGKLITIPSHSPTMLKTTNAEFSFIEIWFTDQNNRPLKIEDNVNITLIIRTT